MASPAPNDHRPLLASQPDSALLFVLGMLAAKPMRASEAGRFAAICTELQNRGIWTELLGSLDDTLAQSILMLERADRGQHFATTGQRRLV